MIDGARRESKTVHFATLIDLCHKNVELEEPLQKNISRVVLRGDFLTHDSSSVLFFTEQGSSALNMTAAKVRDVGSTVPGCAGQARDAVWAFTQVKWKTRKSDWDYLHEIANFLDSFAQIPSSKTWDENQGPVVLLVEMCTDTPKARLLRERQLKRVKVPGW